MCLAFNSHVIETNDQSMNFECSYEITHKFCIRPGSMNFYVSRLEYLLQKLLKQIILQLRLDHLML